MRLQLLFLVISLISLRSEASDPTQTSVLVYGATPGGIAAAVSAAKAGKSVTLVEPTDRIGGMLTCGLSHSDFRSFESLNGFFLEFSQQVQADYERRYGVDSAQATAAFRGTHAEPSVNLRILQSMLAQYPLIRVVAQARLQSVQTSEFLRGRRRLKSATFSMPGGKLWTLEAKMFIDGSYEGDLMASAGENYHIGRESRSQYNEPLAGDEMGNADGQVQGYNLRLIMTTDASNQRPVPEPEGYDRQDFVGVLSVFQSTKVTRVFSDGHDGIYRAHLPLLPNGKADVNDTPRAAVRLSMPDINDAYPDGDPTTRATIVRQHYYYNLGLLYFLQNDAQVPHAVRQDANRWALCQDEFENTGGIPPQLYVREARRLVGQHVFTGNDTRQLPGDARAVRHADSIAIGDYVHNCHGTGRKGTRFQGEHSGEFYKPVPPYQILYGVIVPTKSENLLVPVACSASHFGFGALRLEPIWCSLGQAAGWAASQSIDRESAVQEIDVGDLQQLLHADGSATTYISDVPPNSPDFAAVQWLAIQGGFHGLAEADQPKPASLGGQYCQAHPGHAANPDFQLDDELRARWQALTAFVGEDKAKTRIEWIRQAYADRKNTRPAR